MQHEPAGAPESTVELLSRARAGDAAALNEVLARAIPLLKRWASGRLPRWTRDIIDTDDLVQDTVINTLNQIEVFEYRVDSALQAYLRQAVMNRIRNEIRRAIRHPAPAALDSAAPDAGLSPLEELIGRQTTEAYDEAMAGLEPEEREAIIGRSSWASVTRNSPQPWAGRLLTRHAWLSGERSSSSRNASRCRDVRTQRSPSLIHFFQAVTLKGRPRKS